MRSFPLLSLVVVVPALGALLLRQARRPERMRQMTVGVAALTLALTAGVLGLFHLTTVGPQLEESWFRVPGLGLEYRLGVDGMSVLALPLIALLTLGLVAAGPRQALDRDTLGALLLTESMTLGFFCAEDLALMVLFFVAILMPVGRLIWRSARARAEARTLRTFRAYMVAGTLPLLLATILVGVAGRDAGTAGPFGLQALTARGLPEAWRLPLFTLLMLAVCVRMAVVPFHSWLPVLVSRGPFGASVLLINAHAGLYLLVRVVIPLFPEQWARVGPAMGALGLCCALYGSVLALSQTDLRRVVGFLMVSQSGLLLTGLALGNTQGIAGALVQSVAAGIALTGLILVVRAIESRTGTTDMNRLGGLVRRAPRLAAFFFLMGFATLGFPGTLSFVGEDLLLHGILDAHPLVALPLLLTTAINGVTLLRSFQRTFLGTPAHGHAPVVETVEDMMPRERWAVFSLLALVLLGGLMPGPLLRLRATHVETLVGHVAEAPRAD
ncbi:complex I subunit 4 family protein [Archangium primigenium]|uniref:complex I subunit 4 family protein n=1 Tax=[Archangium] primigenium TaxID=2792470 RepID=UPI00195A1715|nr:NADH-quinone oxidoreductase subunit M [Archangium primigenium]MBM7114525.1 NADH-quinone oxidoreductase subunit M [Archangium primigenium]